VRGDYTARIERDFQAGFTDSDPAGRLASIQRLAGLASPASREALRDLIVHGSNDESRWALFADVKTGDASMMALAVPVLLALKHEKPGPYPRPDGELALALKKLHTEDAVPYLIQIVDQASDELVRDCAMQALAELKSRAALTTYARHLTDSSQYVRYNALLGMKYVTESPACSTTDPDKADAAEQQCRLWWESTGVHENQEN
jgi:HEAT repeat protein